eukprot:Colp12_sorted_trinity150504_noHs@20126
MVEPSKAQDEALAAEIEALKMELDWLLSCEVPRVFMQLGKIIKDCWNKLSVAHSYTYPRTPTKGSKLPPTPTSQKPPSVHTLPLTTANDALKGFTVINGYKIVRADLQFKLAKYNKGQPVKTTISDYPLVLPQIQNAANYLQLALTELDNTCLQNGLFHTREQVYMVVQYVEGCLKKAKDHLLLPDDIALSDLADLSMILYPALPQDLVIDFHVDHASFVTSIHYVSTNTVHPDSSKVVVKAPGCTSLRGVQVGQFFKRSGQWLEVLDCLEMEYAFPSLSNTLDSITAAHELCQSLAKKMLALAMPLTNPGEDATQSGTR